MVHRATKFPGMLAQSRTRQQSQCLFCLFGNSSRQTRTSQQTRRYATTISTTFGNNSNGRGSRNRSSQRDVSNKNEKGGPQSKSNQCSPGLRITRQAFDATGTTGKQSSRPAAQSIGDPFRNRLMIKKKVLMRLRHMRDQMKKNKLSPGASISELDQLDPDGTEIVRFQDEIETLLEMEGYRRSKAQSELYRVLTGKSHTEEWSDIVDKHLRFAFLDRTLGKLSRQARKETGYVADLRYPTEWYGRARAQQRDIHLHVGPTNSGKTYNALKRLEEAGDGFYAGPLRLLAHEVYARFRGRGIACDLITGDDVRLDPGSGVKLYASTVEMVDVGRECEVAVIDEIQMMGSEDRGWAWTRAFLGANAKEVHLCGETRVVPLIRELAASMGDTLHVHQYERLNALKAMSRSLRGNLKSLRKGDCVVSFSVVGIHALKKQIESDTGRRVAIVYGSLPPETRAAQAALFNDPNNDYDFLVASDAIGMGLNLSIKRVVFESIYKHNGVTRQLLSVPQIKQIAGRAGRYRSSHADMVQTSGETKAQSESRTTSSIGLVTCLDEQDLPIIQKALNTEPPPLATAGILPPGEVVAEFAARLPPGLPFEYLLRYVCDIATIHPRFSLSDIKDNLRIAGTIEQVKGLAISDRTVISASPAGGRDARMASALVAIARAIADQKPVTIADLPEIPLEILELPLSPDREYMASLEVLHKSLILYLWLSYRFTIALRDRPMAMHAKELCEEKINRCLVEFSSHPRLMRRLEKIKQEQERMESEFALDAEPTQLPPDSSEMDGENTLSPQPVVSYDRPVAALSSASAGA